MSVGLLIGTNFAYADPAAAAAPNWPLVQSGHAGDRVTTVQHLLRHDGASIDADGQFGPKTLSATKSFQSANGLDSDGIVGPMTWPKLTVDVDSGDANEAVKALQVLLKRHGGEVSVSGTYDTATGDAVAAFKEEHGVGGGSLVDDTTWQYLVGASPPVGDHSLPIDRDALPRSEYDDPHHDYPAIDLPTPTGTPALATVAGTVVLINDSSCGKGVNLTDAAGNRYTYCHFSAHSVSNGAQVAAGEQIGLTGNTGNSTGPHLHFAIRVPPSSTSVCPQNYLLAIYDGTEVPDPTTLPRSGCTY
ncbi:putative peptidoglycan binding protein [Stackebrandtia endophytica]|uniref:Putative peptidoglycan binding protein n=1 Tax=Stackebrandtia endophytica TaxID=1496996 RepID=A0A543ATT3_9ACTN|nr:peptidoglycan DD-metalloendopeptidase family protein [Stackebrandtia endophytica]TQL75969.1 putative peptidoglycan binding protein [Stackebrandtia endophytica]